MSGPRLEGVSVHISDFLVVIKAKWCVQSHDYTKHKLDFRRRERCCRCLSLLVLRFKMNINKPSGVINGSGQHEEKYRKLLLAVGWYRHV